MPTSRWSSPTPLPVPRARHGDRDDRPVRDRRTRPRDGLRARMLHLAGLRARPPLPVGHDPFLDRVLPSHDGVPRRGADGAHRDGRDQGRASATPGPVAGGPRLPARPGAGGGRRRRRRDRSRPVVGHGAFRGCPPADRRRDVRRERRVPRRRDPERGQDRRPIVLTTRAPPRSGRRSPAPRRHVRARQRRAARVHGLAADGRQARPDARRRGHGDVPAPRARRDRDAARALDRDPGADGPRAPRYPRAPLVDRLGALRRADPRGRCQRVDATPALGRRGARGAVRPDLGDGRGARHHLEAGRRLHRTGTRSGEVRDRGTSLAP